MFRFTPFLHPKKVVHRRDSVVVRASASQSVDLGFISLSRVIPNDFKKWYSQLQCLALSIKKRDGVESKLASLLVVSLGKALNGTPPSLCGKQVAYPFPPGYNCEVASPACRKKRLLGTHQWQSALLMVGLPVTHDWFKMGCHLFP